MNQLINEQRERIARLERVNDGLSSTIEKMELAAKELGYDNSMTCSELDYLIETARAVVMVNQKNLELTSQLVAVKESGGTGQSPCAKFCESVALGKDLYQLREHADKMQVERDTLKQQNAELAAQVEALRGHLAQFPKTETLEEAVAWEDKAKSLTKATLPQCPLEVKSDDFSDGCLAQKAFWEGFERGTISHNKNIRSHWSEWSELKQGEAK
jgi:uncharacterized protein YhaN